MALHFQTREKKGEQTNKKTCLFVCRLHVLYIFQRLCPWGEGGGGSLLHWGGAEVGVCKSQRWYTEMESDSCQERSALLCPLHRKSREKRSAHRRAASVYCLAALAVYRTETHQPSSPLRMYQRAVMVHYFGEE